MRHGRRICILLLLIGLPLFSDPTVHGIGNFHQVDGHVFRGAQPTGEGIRDLAKNGVKLVIDLRESGRRSAAEEAAVTAAGMRYVNIPMSGLTPPTNAETAQILQLLEDSSTGPVFVHCLRGADRTGAVIAAYRIHHDHWENARALREAIADGMSFFQYPRQAYIRNFKPDSMAITAGGGAPATPTASGDGSAQAAVQ